MLPLFDADGITSRRIVGSPGLRPRLPIWPLVLLVVAVNGCQPSGPKAAAPVVTRQEPPSPTHPTPWQQRPGHGKWVELRPYVSIEPGPGRFGVAVDGHAATLVVSANDHTGVVRAVHDLQTDIERVSLAKPELVMDQLPSGRDEIILVGTLGKNRLVDRLVQKRKLDTSGLVGRWETFLLTTVDHPFEGISRALVIAGSDPRGTIYGIYDLCKQIGISPWHFWADVPPQQKRAVYVLPGQHTLGEPAVKYRGFFINDEEPSLGNWALSTFGPGHEPQHPRGFNHAFYAKVFELMLRLKANYLWPAVWDRAFAEDDPENQDTADHYGIVMGTSHEAPLNRGIEEWNRRSVPPVRDAEGNITQPGKDAYGGTGEWSFRRNRAAVEAHWLQGARRIRDSEVIVTLGMRGNGDTRLQDGAGIELMQNIVQSQRQILTAATKKELSSIPQVWTLYKEVQQYWERGLRAPDDVTIVWCDDNWGNLRKLPDLSLPPRAGGYGIYYHFDYVGDSRNYKWVDTSSLPNTWEQLHLAYAYGVDQVWMVNVGDIKNVELPLEFFLDYAWSPERWPIARLHEWEQQWAQEQFGPGLAEPIAELLRRYAQLQARRKPELLNRRTSLDSTKDLAKDPQHAVVHDDAASPFSLNDYRELERVVSEWQALAGDAARLGRSLPAHLADAYFELVMYRIQATRVLYELRLAEFTNLRNHAQGRASTNERAARAVELFKESQELADYFNRVLANGKWKGFQTQPYIGYGDVARYGTDAPWQQPQTNNVAIADQLYPPVQRLAVPAAAALGVAIDGSDKSWPGEPTPAELPHFSPFQRQPTQYIEVFNRGAQPFEFEITPSVPWIHVTPNRGQVDQEVRALLSVDWAKVPIGTHRVPIIVSGARASRVTVQAMVENFDIPKTAVSGFIESNGYVSIEAEHYSHSITQPPIFWQQLDDIGRTGSGMTSFPVTAPSQLPTANSPRLEYEAYLFSQGPIELWTYHSPRNNVLYGDGIRYAVSIDDEGPVVVNITRATGAEPMNDSWARNTGDNVTRTSTRHVIAKPGRHVVKYWRVDPTMILQKLVIDTGGLKPSYLGPPESYLAKVQN